MGTVTPDFFDLRSTIKHIMFERIRVEPPTNFSLLSYPLEIFTQHEKNDYPVDSYLINLKFV